MPLKVTKCSSGRWTEDHYELGLCVKESVIEGVSMIASLRKQWLAPLVALTLVALALPALTGTAAAQSANFRAHISQDYVEGGGWAPNALIDITINGTLFDNAAMTGGDGRFIVGFEVFGVGLALGDVVTVSDGTTTKDVTLDGPLSIVVDEVGLTASGVAPSRVGDFLGVGVYGDACQVNTGTFLDGSGTWSIDLSIQCPGGLGTFSEAEIDLQDEDGDSTATAVGAPTCNNRIVTVDVSRGESPTENADVIQGHDGGDTIDALGGNDVVCGLGGDDVINGGAGKDTLVGGDGDDTLDGGDGNDKLVGGDGNDTLLGQDGRDIIQGGNGNDIAEGGKKNDRISGNGGRDTLNGGNGKDRIDGQSGPDTIIGGGGNDRLIGGGGVDTIDGRVGNDFCVDGETMLRCEFDFIP
jgi:Ca2+-binding RTX toxin-like protein